MMVWSASGSLVINKMSGCPPRPVSPHHCPGEHRVLGDISVTNSSAPWGILARAEELGEWGLGWEHEETLSASDIMTGSTKHHWYKDYKLRVRSLSPMSLSFCANNKLLIICQNQTLDWTIMHSWLKIIYSFSIFSLAFLDAIAFLVSTQECPSSLLKYGMMKWWNCIYWPFLVLLFSKSPRMVSRVVLDKSNWVWELSLTHTMILSFE